MTVGAMKKAGQVGDPGAALARARTLLKEGRDEAALAAAASLLEAFPDSPAVFMLASVIEQKAGRFDSMLGYAERAAALAPRDAEARFRLLEALLYTSRPDRVTAALRDIESGAGSDARLLCRTAEFWTHCMRHEDALRCYEQAVALEPSSPDFCFSLAASMIAVGDLDSAGRLLDEVIRMNPHDYDAYRNRATLRKWTPDENHVDEIRRRFDAGVRHPAGEVQLCYALAKEYEDLGDYGQSFAWLKRGAAKRRSLLRYRVETDVDAIERIMQAFDRRLFERAAPGCDAAGNVFVLGLPRSGTTLVDRILSSHAQVSSLGEINDFAYCLIRSAGVAEKKALIERAAKLDFGELGRRYHDATRRYGSGSAFTIDKTPLNFLYLGLIRLALPGARIVHVCREPMDSCFGMYRTLFRAGYPFSYDFDDLASYYAAYRRLMAHWREVLPGAWLDVSYERLVDDQEGVSREILAHCGLDWDPACLDFHENSSPVLTASSAQVRRPLYRGAVGRWRRYESQLAPLAAKLEARGVAT